MSIFDIFRIRRHPAIAEPTMDAIVNASNSVADAKAAAADAQEAVRVAREHVLSFGPLTRALFTASCRAKYHPNGDVTVRAEHWKAVTDALGKIGCGK